MIVHIPHALKDAHLQLRGSALLESKFTQTEWFLDWHDCSSDRRVVSNHRASPRMQTPPAAACCLRMVRIRHSWRQVASRAGGSIYMHMLMLTYTVPYAKHLAASIWPEMLQMQLSVASKDMPAPVYRACIRLLPTKRYYPTNLDLLLTLLPHLGQAPPHRLLRLGRRHLATDQRPDERHEPAKAQHPYHSILGLTRAGAWWCRPWRSRRSRAPINSCEELGGGAVTVKDLKDDSGHAGNLDGQLLHTARAAGWLPLRLHICGCLMGGKSDSR